MTDTRLQLQVFETPSKSYKAVDDRFARGSPNLPAVSDQHGAQDSGDYNNHITHGLWLPHLPRLSRFQLHLGIRGRGALSAGQWRVRRLIGELWIVWRLPALSQLSQGGS